MRLVVAALAIAALLILVEVYLASGQEGRYYNYEYYFIIEGPPERYCITMPVPVLANGTLFPHLEWTKFPYLGREWDPPNPRFVQSIVRTERGLGFQFRFEGTVLVSVEGEYNACLESEDHRSDGEPRLSTIMPTSINPGTIQQVAWVLSDTAGFNVTVSFEATWGNWVVTPFGGHHVRGGSGRVQSLQGNTTEGWSGHLVDIGDIEVD